MDTRGAATLLTDETESACQVLTARIRREGDTAVPRDLRDMATTIALLRVGLADSVVHSLN